MMGLGEEPGWGRCTVVTAVEGRDEVVVVGVSPGRGTLLVREVTPVDGVRCPTHLHFDSQDRCPC